MKVHAKSSYQSQNPRWRVLERLWCSISRKRSSQNSTTKNNVTKHNVHMTEITWPKITCNFYCTVFTVLCFSTRRWTKDKLFENLLLIHLHLFEVDQKWVSNSLKMDQKRYSIMWSLISGENLGRYLIQFLNWTKNWTVAYNQGIHFDSE